MAVLRTLLVLALTLTMSPGVLELLDDGLHFVQDGRTDHEEGEESCPEHGCTATAHHCGCCSSLAFVDASMTLSVPSDVPRHRPRALEQGPHGPRGVTSQHHRPPIA